nr:PREDICTED: interferon-inducible double-stranded RNA-dependent protein kinase activator A-like [Bemisia tabaci]XP_018905152.1 PREDICTED: interferon-inducible double-stranded RNA-dependent protein kinase activator A-like [Bemisia tabaci]XP_018905153.1 PREDICTED: interferon-inducible double-stranded RNA-dependent protein kinase activator A-like [Bemisia tabaci]
MSLSNIGQKTAASILQEHLMKLGHVPQYDLVRDDTGTHIPTFTYRLEFNNVVVEGTGSSKKEAKQTTARLMLEKLGITSAEEMPKIEPTEALPMKKVCKYNSVGALTEFCAQMKMAQGPQYFDVREEGPPHAKLFTVRCSVSLLSETAVAGTKKQAKQQAAQQMLTRLKNLQVIDDENQILSPGSFEVVTPEDEQPLLSEDLKQRVMDHFKALHSFTSQQVCGSSVSKYHTVFKSENTTASEVISNLVSLVRNPDAPLNYNLEALQEGREELFKEVISELNVEETFIEIPDDENPQILLNVSHAPNVSFLACASSKEIARKIAISQYLQFISTLVS